MSVRRTPGNQAIAGWQASYLLMHPFEMCPERSARICTPDRWDEEQHYPTNDDIAWEHESALRDEAIRESVGMYA